MKIYDVIIVGAGPTGAIAGYTLSEASLMHALPLLNIQALRASSTLQGWVIDLLRGNCTYQEVWQGLAKLLPKYTRYILHRK